MPEVEILLPKFKPKQQLIWDSDATEILIAGDTRSGKSFFVRKAYILLCSQIPGLITDILRLNYEDVLKNYMVGETSFPALLDPWERAGLVKITENEIRFWNGSLITLGHCSDERALRKHQGNQTHLRTIDESAQFTESQLRGLGGWITITEQFRKTLPERFQSAFPKIWHLTNFIGPGMGYYRNGFLEPRAPFAIEQVGQHRRQYIPMYLIDNDSEDAQRTIARIKEAFPDPSVQKALLECDWRAMVGDFLREFKEDKHVIPDHMPPAHLFKYRTFDWGVADPAACCWFYVADGQPIPGVGKLIPRGALVMYREWYVCNPNNRAEGGLLNGQRYRNEDLARGIVARTTREENCSGLTLADSKPFQDGGGQTIAEVFMNNGCPLQLADTKRISGWAQLRSRLIGFEDGNGGSVPMIYFTESCSAARTYIPLLQRHPTPGKEEDAQEHGEATHICDAVRYACTARPLVRDTPIDQTKWVATTVSTDNITFEQAIKRNQQLKRRRDF